MTKSKTSTKTQMKDGPLKIGSILSSISSLSSSFTKSEKKIAEVLIDHTGVFVNNNLGYIANMLDLGEATVIRFCRTLGFKGYSDFKLALAVEHNSKNPAQAQENDTLIQADIVEEDSPQHVALKLAKLVNRIVGETVNLIDYDQLVKVSRALLTAQRVVVMGIGSSHKTATLSTHRFLRIGIFMEDVGDRNSMFIRCSQVTNRDVVIGISYTGETEEICQAMSIARDHGAVTVAVTHNLRSTVTKYSDYVLANGSRQKTLAADSIGSKTSQLFLMDILYAMVVQLDYNRAKSVRDKFNYLIESHTKSKKLK